MLALVASIFGVAVINAQQPDAGVWTKHFNETLNGNAQAFAVAVDARGNVFVTGTSEGSTTANDFTTIKYSSAGVLLWNNLYNRHASGTDEARAIAVDGAGNVVVTGFSQDPVTGTDFTTIKYTSGGVGVWTKRYSGPFSGTDQARAITVDGGNNVIVAGFSAGAVTGDDFVTIKYTSAGVGVWTNRFNRALSGNDQATAVAGDNAGNVFVTGIAAGAVTGTDFATIKYTSTGVGAWTNYFSSPASNNDGAVAIAVDAAGNVIVTGYATRSATGVDFATVKYSNTGTALWTNFFNGTANGADRPAAVAVDSAGNVFVTGQSASQVNDVEFVTIGYASNTGERLWVNRYNGTVNGPDVPHAMAVDGNGNVFVTGQSIGSTSAEDFATIAYSGAGARLWVKRYNGLANGSDVPHALAVDNAGNVIVTGQSMNTHGDLEFVTIKYTGFGAPPVPLINFQIGAPAAPRIDYQIVGNQLVLSWTDPAFSLQSDATGLGNYTTINGATSPYTNIVSGPQQFFRLIKD